MTDNHQKLTFIIISQQAWDTDIGSNCKNIAIELSRNNNVLYVNSPLDRITRWKSANDPKVQKRLNVIRGKENGLIRIDEHLWTLYPDCLVESINWISSKWIFDSLNRRNNKKLSKSILKATDQLTFKGFVLLNDNEMFKGFYLKDFLNPRVAAYYSRDYMIGVDYWKKHGERIEPKLIAKSDLCFANSVYLQQYCLKYNIRSYYVGQGCEVDAFMNVDQQRPSDMTTLAGKIIGYVGSLNSQRLSIEVIAHIASKFPNYQIVLVGPEDAIFKASRLHQFANIHFLGQKSVDELPAYVNSFDVCINPQVVNEITIGNYPRKIDEYLAAGKPVVATNTLTMDVFKNHVYLADSQEEFAEQIERAINENSDLLIAERIKFVSTHTWGNSVQLMLDQVRLLISSTL